MRMRSAGVLLTYSLMVSNSIAAADARVYDIRPPVNGLQRAPNTVVQGKIDAFQRQLGPDAMIHVNWDNVANQLRSISFAPPLPQPQAADATRRARAFLETNPELFGLPASSIEAMTPEIEERQPQRDVISLHQVFGGISFFDQQGFLRVVATPAGIVSASGRYATEPPGETTPRLSISDAYGKLRQQLPNLWKTADGKPSPHDGASGPPNFEPDTRLFARGDETLPARQRTLIKQVGMDFTNELTGRLTYYLDGAQARLTWEFNMSGTQDRFNDPGMNASMIGIFEVLVDAQDGRVLFAHVDAEPAPHDIAGPLSEHAQ
jgi:hypothetical protein